MAIITSYGLFLLKFFTFFAFIFFSSLLYNMIKKKSQKQKKIKITILENHYKEIKNDILLSKMNKYEKKIWIKKENKKNKIFFKKNNFFLKKNENLIKNKKNTLFILDFYGDTHASNVISLREEISAIILTANKDDAVLLRLESYGGIIYEYGLATAQLQRLRQHGIHLIVAIDKIAASGGYMMACVANYIIATPFSIVGSIGVVAQLPNFNKLLKKNNIDIELHTAGDYKRTLTMFGENNELMRKKFCEELNIAHDLFKKFVKEMRPMLDIDNIANGEHWFGRIALEKKLIDKIDTSDNFLMSKSHDYTLLHIKYIHSKKTLLPFNSLILNNIKKIIMKIFFKKIYKYFV